MLKPINKLILLDTMNYLSKLNRKILNEYKEKDMKNLIFSNCFYFSINQSSDLYIYEKSESILYSEV